MNLAVLVLAILLTVQFLSALKKDCMNLVVLFCAEIVLFGYIVKGAGL